jgi:uncharacterized protein YndB with AHSA1/START domain
VWGPPSYPATVVEHDLRLGGRVTQYMTGPEGDKHAGYWQVTAVNEPNSFSFDDGFADLDFNPNPAMPVSKNVYTFTEHDGGTRTVYQTSYETAKALHQVLDMGHRRRRHIGDQPGRRAARGGQYGRRVHMSQPVGASALRRGPGPTWRIAPGHVSIQQQGAQSQDD